MVVMKKVKSYLTGILVLMLGLLPGSAPAQEIRTEIDQGPTGRK